MRLLIPAPGHDCREGFSSMVSYLRRLEAESIQVMREVVGEFRRPVFERDGMLIMRADEPMALKEGNP